MWLRIRTLIVKELFAVWRDPKSRFLLLMPPIVQMLVFSFAATQQQAILGTFVFNVPANLLSGFASPIENMPDWLQTVTLANPLRHYLIIVKGLFLKDMPAAEVLRNLWPLAVIALLTLTAATWLFQRRLE